MTNPTTVNKLIAMHLTAMADAFTGMTLILNAISPLLQSCWGFSFALGCGVCPQAATAPELHSCHTLSLAKYKNFCLSTALQYFEIVSLFFMLFPFPFPFIPLFSLLLDPPSLLPSFPPPPSLPSFLPATLEYICI